MVYEVNPLGIDYKKAAWIKSKRKVVILFLFLVWHLDHYDEAVG